jgi:uncharacterized protein (UPF0335 family)
MEIPEQLREIVDRLGVALVKALANDESSRALVQEIQSYGFDMALMLEATVALHKRESEEGEAGIEPDAQAEAASGEGGYTLDQGGTQWSEEDRAFLKTFKISLE